MNKKITITLAVLVIIAAALFWWFMTRQPSEDQVETTTRNSEHTLCPQDVRQCSDGIYVHRTAPSCEFEKCSDGSDATATAPVFEDGTVPSSSSTSPSASTTTNTHAKEIPKTVQ